MGRGSQQTGAVGGPLGLASGVERAGVCGLPMDGLTLAVGTGK